jgi:hypothetical protein
VGNFVCRSGAADGTPIRVCSTPDKIGLSGFALDTAQQQLALFNKYFGITYPFGKLDLLASIRNGPRSASARTSRRWCRTRSPTSGSATW